MLVLGGLPIPVVPGLHLPPLRLGRNLSHGLLPSCVLLGVLVLRGCPCSARASLWCTAPLCRSSRPSAPGPLGLSRYLWVPPRGAC